jgi:hypothetical protein
VKPQTAGSTLCLLAILVFGSLVSAPTARAQTSSSQNLVITGSLPILSYEIDLCKAILSFTSCSISASITENYTQPVRLQVTNSPDALQPQMTETSQLTLNPSQPVVVLDLKFSLGTHSFPYSLPLPSLPVPGTLPISISLDSILQGIITTLGLPIPISLLSLVADLKLNLFFATQLQGVITTQGFTSNAQSPVWNALSTTETYSASLTGQPSTAAVTLSELDAVAAFGGDLSLKFLFSSYKLYSFPNTTLTFGSTNSPTTIADWYHIKIQSPYSQPSGSGWYLSGTTAAFSVADTTVPATGGSYQFTGWTATGSYGYSGTQRSEDLTATGPANETADWTFVPDASPASFLAPMEWALGILLAAALVAVVAVVVVLARRPKHT